MPNNEQWLYWTERVTNMSVAETTAYFLSLLDLLPNAYPSYVLDQAELSVSKDDYEMILRANFEEKAYSIKIVSIQAYQIRVCDKHLFLQDIDFTRVLRHFKIYKTCS